MDFSIREMRASEYYLLEDFLYEAIFIPKGYGKELPRSIIRKPELWRTIDKFGSMKDDYCLVAVVGDRAIGAVWSRITDQYGYIDDETPSLSISLYPGYRGRGIGTALMRAMVEHLKSSGYHRVSLSVQKDNYAVKMYKNVGFAIIDEDDKEYLMTLNL